MERQIPDSNFLGRSASRWLTVFLITKMILRSVIIIRRAWERIYAGRILKCFTCDAHFNIAIVAIRNTMWWTFCVGEYLSTIICFKRRIFVVSTKEKIKFHRAALLSASADYRTESNITRISQVRSMSAGVLELKRGGSRIISIAAMRCPQWIEAWATRFLKASLSCIRTIRNNSHRSNRPHLLFSSFPPFTVPLKNLLIITYNALLL